MPEGAPRSGSAGLVPLAVAVVGIVLIAAVVVVSRGSGDDGDSADVAVGGGEIFLEPIAETGPEPFTDTIEPPTATTAAPMTTAPDGSPPPPAVVNAPTSGIAAPPGSPPYGGSGDNTVCDREKIVTFLTANAAQAEAWGGVLGVEVAAIPDYVRSLTPAVLLYDTRVTNHGFSGGKATPRQSVLQAGTAVLVDAAGNPVVRCKCGNPLQAPTPIPAPTYEGDAWAGFDASASVAIDDGVTVEPPPGEDVGESPPEQEGEDEGGGSSTTTADDGAGPDPGSPEQQASIIIQQVMSECSKDATTGEVTEQEDIPDTYAVVTQVDGTEALFLVNLETGDIAEGDQPSAKLIEECGIL